MNECSANTTQTSRQQHSCGPLTCQFTSTNASWQHSCQAYNSASGSMGMLTSAGASRHTAMGNAVFTSQHTTPRWLYVLLGVSQCSTAKYLTKMGTDYRSSILHRKIPGSTGALMPAVQRRYQPTR